MKSTKEVIGMDTVAPAQRRARDRVFEAASNLFRDQGIRAVGVEKIVKTAGVATHAKDPRSQLRAHMSFIADSATASGYCAYPFINYSAEFSDPSHPGHRVAEANRLAMRRRLLQWARAIKAVHPAKLADGPLLLFDGAYASSRMLGGPKERAAALTWAADALIAGRSEKHGAFRQS